MARLADARHVQTATVGLGLLDEALGGGDGVVVNRVHEGGNLLLHDAEEDVNGLLVVRGGGDVVVCHGKLSHLLADLLVVSDVEDADDVGELALNLGGKVAHGDDDVTVIANEVLELAVLDVDAVSALGADLLDLRLEQHAGADTGAADNQGVDHVRVPFSLLVMNLTTLAVSYSKRRCRHTNF